MECQCWDKQFYKVSNMCNEEASCCTSLFHFHLHKIHLILEMLKSNLYTWDTCEVWRCEVGNSSCEAKTNYMMNKFLNYILLYMLTRSQDCQSIWLVFAHGNSMSCLQKNRMVLSLLWEQIMNLTAFLPSSLYAHHHLLPSVLALHQGFSFLAITLFNGGNLLRFAKFRAVQPLCFLKRIPFWYSVK